MPIYRWNLRQRNNKMQWYTDLLEQGDSVMADKRFDIDDLLRAKGVVNIPPVYCSRCKKTKTISRLRIHVERQ